MPGRFLLLIVVLVGGDLEEGWAQGGAAVSPDTVSAPQFCERTREEWSGDLRGFAVVYCTTAPEVTLPLHGAHATARPLFYGAVPVAWIGAGVTQDRETAAAAYRLTVAQGLTYGLVLGVKHTVGRSRPYVHHSLTARVRRYRGVSGRKEGDLSFPSGHASISAAIATSWGLSVPRWYVIGPGAVWATGVALSRLHLGVHYPSDILVGLVIGAGVALLVHHVRRTITPRSLRTPAPTQQAPAMPVGIRIRF